MKQYTNTYIFIFSSVMVIIVAALLSFVSMKLKPVQDNNIKVEQMKNILASVNIASTAGNAEELFSDYITDSYVISSTGEKISNLDPLAIDLKQETDKIDAVNDLKLKLAESKESPFKKLVSGFTNPKETDRSVVNKEISTVENSMYLPVYICNKDGKSYYIFALRGKGLWGPIWGYISLEDDFNTVYGAYFDHKSETPGLGAEISTLPFQEQFKGKQIFDGTDKFVSVKVNKGETSANNPHSVDAISGGTITSKGVEKMISDWLSAYKTFINNQKN